jgi:hypothetical protein
MTLQCNRKHLLYRVIKTDALHFNTLFPDCLTLPQPVAKDSNSTSCSNKLAIKWEGKGKKKGKC